MDRLTNADMQRELQRLTQPRAGLFLPKSWTVVEHPGFVTNFNDAVPVEPQTFTLTEYVQFPLHVGEHEVVTFYIEKSMTPENALLRLAECYKP